MSTLLEEINAKAIQLGIPLGVHLDVTWRCNERCVHCYLDHDDQGELTFDEITDLLDADGGCGGFLPDDQRRRAAAAQGPVRDHPARARADFQRQAQDQRDPDSGKRSRADSRAGRRNRSGQHLLPSPRGSRRDHESEGLARPLARCDSLSGVAGAQGHDGQRDDEQNRWDYPACRGWRRKSGAHSPSIRPSRRISTATGRCWR